MHNGNKVQIDLNQAVKMWPTPEASSGGRQYGSFNQKSWMKADGTPRHPSLAQAIKMWPTQTFHTPRTTPRSAKEYDGVTPLGNGGLNPTWVEWLMGFPLGWTVLEASATPSSRKSRKS